MSLLTAIKGPLEVGAPEGVPDDEDMDAINAYASAPLAPEQVFVYPCVMANRAMSSYGLNMDDSTLVNFARGAQDGTPVHIMHDRLYRNVGYTFAGHWDDSAGEARAAVFIVRGRSIKDSAGFGGQREQNTSQEIADIQQGLRRAVSVGTGGAFTSYVCNICGKDAFSWFYEEDGCEHIPGLKRDGIFATVRLLNGTLVELSNVDSGAIPGAEIGRPYAGGRRIEAAPYLTSQEFIPPVGTVGYAAPAFGSPFLPKVVKQFRAGQVGRGELSAWLDFRGLTDETKQIFAPTGANPPGGNPAGLKGEDMNWKAILKKAGFHAAAALLPDGDITAEQFTACFAAIVAAQAETEIAAHPVLTTMAAAQIETPAQFMELVSLAEAGRVFTDRTAEELRANCNRAFGEEKGPIRFKALQHLPVSAQAELSEQFATLADDMFGIGEAADGGAEAASARNAAPLNDPKFAGQFNVDKEGWGNPKLKEQAKGIAARTRSRRNASAPANK